MQKMILGLVLIASQLLIAGATTASGRAEEANETRQSAADSAPALPQTAEQAAAQRARAAALRDQAEARYAAEQTECYHKFLMNDCLAAAKKRYTAAIVDARALDLPASEVERELRRQEIEASDAQRLAEQPRREAEQKAAAERYRAEQAEKLAERERKLADKARQAEEGRRQAAAEQAKRQAKDGETRPPGERTRGEEALPARPGRAPPARSIERSGGRLAAGRRSPNQAIPWLARYSS
jgi:colicin import membrane protein